MFATGWGNFSSARLCCDSLGGSAGGSTIGLGQGTTLLVYTGSCFGCRGISSAMMASGSDGGSGSRAKLGSGTGDNSETGTGGDVVSSGVCVAIACIPATNVVKRE